MMRNGTLFPGARQPDGTAAGLPATPLQVAPTAELLLPQALPGITYRCPERAIRRSTGDHSKVQIPS
jgi:hypothetical protein